MRPAYMILLMSAVTSAQEVVVEVTRLAHVLVVKEVYLNDQGPFRMMVDTGAASCQIRPAVAGRLGLRPAYAVEHETIAGLNRVPAAILDELRIGPIREQAIEIIITNVKLPGVDGVLGQSWLIRHDYLLDYRGPQLMLETSEPKRGIRAALRSSDARPMIAAEVDGHLQDLVVDSGASVLVLFGRSQLATLGMLLTNGGRAEAEMHSARVRIGANYTRRMQTAEVNAPTVPGLLPACAFRSVYISNRNGMVVLVP